MTLPASGYGTPGSPSQLGFQVGTASNLESTLDPQLLARRTMLAIVLDQWVPNAQPFQDSLRSNPDVGFRATWNDLPSATHTQIRQGLGAPNLNAVLNLSTETHLRIFDHDFMRMGRTLEQQGNLPGAQLIYGLMSQRGAGSSAYIYPGLSNELRIQAASQLEVISGTGGPLGRQVEFQLGRFFEVATEPSMIAGMAIGSTVFTSARSLLLPRLMSSSNRILATVPFATRITATGLATVPEVGAFWAASKGIRELMHPGTQSWDAQTNLRELAGLGLTFAFLKPSGFAFGRGARWANSSNPFWWQQAGMLTGIMGGHAAEAQLGWREYHGMSHFLTDSLVTLVHFNAGGALSHAMFPRLYAFNQGLSQRMSLQEHAQLQNIRQSQPLANLEVGSQAWLTQLQALLGAPGNLQLAPAGASSKLGPLLSSARPTREASDLMVMMSSHGENGGNPGGSPAARGGVATRERVSPTSDQTELFLQERYLERTGKRTNSSGQVIDGFERTGGSSAFPHDMLVRLAADPRASILRELGWRTEDIQAVETARDKSSFDRIGSEDFGFAIGQVLRNGMEVFLQGGIEQYRAKDIENDFTPEQQQKIRVLDELIGVRQYALRAQGSDVARTQPLAVIRGIESAWGKNGNASYESLMLGLRHLLNRPLGDPNNPLEAHEAVISYGTGDMMSLLHLLRHQIMPGGLSWRMRLLAIARKQSVADEINQSGRNVEHGTSPLGADKVVNYRNDPRIEIIGPDRPHQGVSQAEALASVKHQILNVPSNALAQSVLSESYIGALPEGARLLQVIKGFIRPGQGRLRPADNEQPSMLPFELVRRALDVGNRPRQDVEVVSGGGFIPGKDLWWNQSVEIGFAGREVTEGRRLSAAARDWAFLFAGEGQHTDYLRAGHSHWQKSTEIGGAMKNVVSLYAGMLAVRRARVLISEGREQLNPEQAEREVNEGIISPLRGILDHMLINEGISENRLGFNRPVETDFRRCCYTQLLAVMELVRRASDPNLDVQNIPALNQWVQTNLVQKRYEFADTRNPIVGIVGGLVEIWRSRNPDLHPNDIEINLTPEGINSLRPLVMRNTHSDHPAERRSLPSEIYDLHDFYNAEPARRQPVVSSEMLRAFEQGLPGVAGVPGISGSEVRNALEGRPQSVFDFLTREIQMLGVRAENVPPQASSDNRDRMKYDRQVELMTRFVQAIREGNPVGVLDFPFYIDPYRNMVRVNLDTQSRPGTATYSFIHMKGTEGARRVSQLGMYLASLGANARGRIDVKLPELVSRENATLLHDVDTAVREILSSYQRTFDGFRVKVFINDREVVVENNPRPPYRQSAYLQELAPVVAWLNQSGEGRSYTARDIRGARQMVRDRMQGFLTRRPGWTMLLGYQGGPIQQALRSGLSRPENRVLFGVYSGDSLSDAFMLYRGGENGHSRPMVVNEQLIRAFEQHIPDKVREIIGRDLQIADDFTGLPWKQFEPLYRAYAEHLGRSTPELRLLPLGNMPIERALAGYNQGVNPAVLRAFLYQASPVREQMLQELNSFYSEPANGNRRAVTEILQRYLDPFEEANQELLASPIIRDLYQIFQKDGSNAIRRLTARRAVSRGTGLPSIAPPPGEVMTPENE